MSIEEGAVVSYIGYRNGHGLELGDEGLVLVSSPTACHVKWGSGANAGKIILVAADDLAPRTAANHDLTDSISEGSLVSFGVRQVYEQSGATGLLNLLNTEGHLACFESIACESLKDITARIRNDPSMQKVLAELDDDEVEEVVSLATAALVRDAFGQEAD